MSFDKYTTDEIKKMKSEAQDYVTALEDHLHSVGERVMRHEEYNKALSQCVALIHELKKRKTVPAPTKPAWMD